MSPRIKSSAEEVVDMVPVVVGHLEQVRRVVGRDLQLLG